MSILLIFNDIYKNINTKHKFSLFFAVNLELIHSLWVPNIFIYNLKTFQVIS